jgi:hypothetical protein
MMVHIVKCDMDKQSTFNELMWWRNIYDTLWIQWKSSRTHLIYMPCIIYRTFALLLHTQIPSCWKRYVHILVAAPLGSLVILMGWNGSLLWRKCMYRARPRGWVVLDLTPGCLPYKPCGLRYVTKCLWAGHQWFMPIILATWEYEIGRVMVWGQCRQTVHETPPPFPK